MPYQVRAKRRDKGQASAEFLLTGIFVFFSFLIALEMIFLMHTYNTLADAAKEGIRYQIVHGTGNTNCSGPSTMPSGGNCPDRNGTYVKTGSGVYQGVVSYAKLAAPLTASNVTVDYNPGGANGGLCNQPGCMVRITISYNYQPIFGLGWPHITIHAAADGRIMN